MTRQRWNRIIRKNKVLIKKKTGTSSKNKRRKSKRGLRKHTWRISIQCLAGFTSTCTANAAVGKRRRHSSTNNSEHIWIHCLSECLLLSLYEPTYLFDFLMTSNTTISVNHILHPILSVRIEVLKYPPINIMSIFKQMRPSYSSFFYI